MDMDQSQVSMDNRRREMECAVCLDKLRQPKTLPCFHNFCGNCLEGLVKDQKISCPTCRKETTLGPGGVGDLPKNIALVSIMESFCEQCLSRDRKIRCDHCGLWMCTQCCDSCKRAQKLTGNGRTLLKVAEVLKREISKEALRLTENLKSVTEQIQTRKQQIVDNAELSAKLLVEEAQHEQAQQSDALGKLTKTVDDLERDISRAIDEDCLKDEDISEEDIEQLTGKWMSNLSSCQSNMTDSKDTNRLIEFIESECVPSIGKITIKASPGFQIDSSEAMEQLNFEIGRLQKLTVNQDYENSQFEPSTFGIQGSAPGQLNFATRIAISAVAKKLVVLDKGNNRIQLFNECHDFLSEFGCKGQRDGQLDFGGYIAGLCVTDNGLIVVADTCNHRLQVFTEHGEHVRSIGSKGSGPGQFDLPHGLAAHGHNIYVCDSYNYRIQVLEVGGKFVRQFGSSDVFNHVYPFDVTTHQNGDIYVAACTKLVVFTSEGESKGVVNTDPVTLHGALGVTTDTTGHIVVSDYNTSVIHILTASGNVLRTLGSKGHGPGQLDGPVGVVCSQDGRILVADQHNHRLQEFSVKHLV